MCPPKQKRRAPKGVGRKKGDGGRPSAADRLNVRLPWKLLCEPTAREGAGTLSRRTVALKRAVL